MSDVLREVASLLYGDGANELVSKLSQAEEKKNRTQARVGLATNVIGIGAGAAATPAAFKSVGEKRNALRVAQGKAPKPARTSRLPFHDVGFSTKTGRTIKGVLKKPKVALGLAAAGAGLQVANLGGDAVANRVLSRESKKKVSKMEPTASDLNIKGRAVKGALKRVNQTPRVQQAKIEVGNKIKEKVGKSAEVVWEGEFSKVDSDKRQVFGWASIVEKNGQPVADLQGDIISVDEIEKSAYDYVIKSRKGGDMHRRNPDDTPVHSSDMIESFLVTPEKIEKLGLPEGSLPLGWWVGFQVNDDDAWNLVKSGKRTAFSIHGRGHRTPVED